VQYEKESSGNNGKSGGDNLRRRRFSRLLRLRQHFRRRRFLE